MSEYNKTNSITEGVIWKQLLIFFFPILFGTLFQSLYNTVDAVIVGQALGKEALAAVSGGTSTMINLIIGFFTGISSGATVMLSQAYGQGDEAKIRKCLHTATAIGVSSGLLVSVLGYIFTVPLLNLISTPPEILPLATRYLHVYFLGATSIVMYNMGAGIFRAVGDSRSPLYFLILGSLMNIVMDILFIVILKRGVSGAAEATVLSQIFSCVITYTVLAKRKDVCRLEVKHILSFNVPILRRMLQIGLPGGIQSIMYNISNMIIQSKVNGFGTDTAAAWASYSKLDIVFWMIINAFGISVTTFVGQNYGAGKLDRVRKGVKECYGMALFTSAILASLYYFFGRYGYLLFTDDKDVIEIGIRILQTICPAFVLYVAIEILSGALRGVGKTLVPTLYTVFGICGLRILWLSSPWGTASIERVMWSYGISWSLVSILFLVYYLRTSAFRKPKEK